MVAVLSFSRAVQRLFEQTWELEPLSVRNTFNGLLWIGGLMLYIDLQRRRSTPRSDAAASNRRDAARSCRCRRPSWSGAAGCSPPSGSPGRALLPFGVVGSALLALYSIGAAVYVPHLFSTYATRYGVIGAVFAMISALFCVMVVVVASAAAGREVDDELDRIRRGERPADDEVRHEWDAVIAETRSRWAVLREQIDRRRGKAAS